MKKSEGTQLLDLLTRLSGKAQPKSMNFDEWLDFNEFKVNDEMRTRLRAAFGAHFDLESSLELSSATGKSDRKNKI